MQYCLQNDDGLLIEKLLLLARDQVLIDLDETQSGQVLVVSHDALWPMLDHYKIVHI